MTYPYSSRARMFFITLIIYRDKTREQQVEIYIQSAPNNSYETYTLCVWAERAILGRVKTTLKFMYEI